MSHIPERWRQILVTFQNAYAVQHGHTFFLYAAPFDSLTEEQVHALKEDDEIVGSVPLSDTDDAERYMILALHPARTFGASKERGRHGPVADRWREAYVEFSELATIAGSSLPPQVRNALSVEPFGPINTWLSCMWHVFPPQDDDWGDLARIGCVPLTGQPFLQSIRVIEECRLDADSPELKNNWARSLRPKADFLKLRIDEQNRRVSRMDRDVSLTRKEWELFVQLLRAGSTGAVKESFPEARRGVKSAFRQLVGELRMKLAPLGVTVSNNWPKKLTESPEN